MVLLSAISRSGYDLQKLLPLLPNRIPVLFVTPRTPRVPPSEQIPNYYAAERGSIYNGASRIETRNF